MIVTAHRNHPKNIGLRGKIRLIEKDVGLAEKNRIGRGTGSLHTGIFLGLMCSSQI